MLLVGVAVVTMTLPQPSRAEPEGPGSECRQCEARWVAGTEHKHVSATCQIPQSNCWDCAGQTCHWGTWVAGGCSDHGHEICGQGGANFAAVKQAVLAGDQLVLAAVQHQASESVQIDDSSGYVLVLDCKGNIAAAYKLPGRSA
jgi:hypothetical protein